MDFIWNKGSVDVLSVFGEAEAGGSPVQSQPGLSTETLSQKEEGREGGKKKVRKKGRKKENFQSF